MNNVALLLHLYQPPVQEEKILRSVAENCYLPLINVLKNKSKFKVTLNLPLSLLEQMDKYGYSKWLEDIKFLVEEGRLELVGSAAYHPLLTKLPDSVQQNQVILNEYSLGYYFGRRSGFEGEEAILVKDLNGFFAPELAVNEQLNLFLNDFGYEWMIVEPTSIPGVNESDFRVFKYEESDCLLIKRDSELSNNIAFFRGLDVKPLLKHLAKHDDLVLALDGETFGHHNEDGIYFLNKFIEHMGRDGKEFILMSDFVDREFNESRVGEISEIRESTWAEIDSKDPYYLWQGNPAQEILWEIYEKIVQKLSENNETGLNDYDGMENIAIWKKEKLPEDVKKEFMLNRLLGSDVFWWLSGEKIAETNLYNPKIVKRFLNFYIKTAEEVGDTELKDFIDTKSKEVIQNLE